jgi:hypothetical protein
MPTLPSLLHVILAMLFMVFGSSPSHADEDQRPKHLYILNDQSNSVFVPESRTIELQIQGITDALMEYEPTCGNISISYFPWGHDAGPIKTIPARSTELRVALANFIFAEADTNRISSNHAAAWSTILDHYRKDERMVVVIITNGRGVFGVFETHEDITVYKVSVLFAEAASYLHEDFLPGQGETRHVVQSRQITELILDILYGFKEECSG